MAFTTHGHHIPGTTFVPRDANWAFIKCGGPDGSCPKCINESLFAINIHRNGSTVAEAITPVDMVRNPFYVKAVQVTAQNMAQVALWCHGTVGTTTRSKTGKEIKCVRVNIPRVTVEAHREARVGDWVVSGGMGYRVYSDKALKDSFSVVGGGVDYSKVLEPAVRKVELGRQGLLYNELLLADANEILDPGYKARMTASDCD